MSTYPVPDPTTQRRPVITAPLRPSPDRNTRRWLLPPFVLEPRLRPDGKWFVGGETNLSFGPLLGGILATVPSGGARLFLQHVLQPIVVEVLEEIIGTDPIEYATNYYAQWGFWEFTGMGGGEQIVQGLSADPELIFAENQSGGVDRATGEITESIEHILMGVIAPNPDAGGALQAARCWRDTSDTEHPFPWFFDVEGLFPGGEWVFPSSTENEVIKRF